MRLDRTLLSIEAERKLFHIGWAILPVLYFLGYPRDAMLLLILIEWIIWASLEFARRNGYSLISPGQLRTHEKNGMLMGTFFQILSLFLAVLFLEKDIAILAMMFNCIGDAVTSYAGALLYCYIGKEHTAIRDYRVATYTSGFQAIAGDLRHAVVHRKSPLLMIVMFATCTAIGLIMYPSASLSLIVAGGIGAVIADAFAWRLLGITIDDDLTITLAAGVAMTFASILPAQLSL